MKWLQDNPVCEVDCKAFLSAEVKKLRDILLRLQEQATELAPTRRSKWQGTVPYLRIIMCLTEDHVKHLFLNRANARTRQEILDGRNSKNSPSYNPVAPPSMCHIDFQTATDCSFEAVSALQSATAQNIQDIFVSMRSNLLQIIQNWERNGQGEGGTDETTSSDAEESRGSAVGNDNVMGGLQGRPARTLESRAAFLYGRPSYLLYFWEIADRHQLLQSSLQRLRDSVGASDASAVPSVVNTNRTPTTRRRRRDDDEDEDDAAALVRPLVQSIRDFAKDEDRRQVALLKSQSDERVFRRRAQLVDEARKYRQLIAELDFKDPRSSRLSDFYKKESLKIEEEISSLTAGPEVELSTSSFIMLYVCSVS